MAASVPLIDPQPLSTADSSAALETLRSLAKKRADSVPLSLQELSSVANLLHTYITTPSRKAPPTKALLHQAVQSLMPKSTALSHRWDKSQLVHVLSEWIKCAQSTSIALQPGILLEICLLRDSKGKSRSRIGHNLIMPDKVYLSQDDGSVSAFSISTPRKEEGETMSPPVDVGPADSASEIPLSQPPIQTFDTPGSIATSASNFLREFNEVADLAATLNETDETAEIAASNIVIPLASNEPRKQPTGEKQGFLPYLRVNILTLIS